MELRQLEYFVAVAEERSFTRAAERVHVSQSGVSAQVRRLERELGAELFDRSTRTVTLTMAGKAALEPARAALAAAAELRQTMSAVTGLLRGQLTVGMVTGCTVTPLFDALAVFHRAHPRVEILLVEDASDRLVHQVRAGGVDLALVGTASADLDGLDALVVSRDRLVAVVPGEHPLARQRHVTLGDLVAHPVACMPPGTGLRTVFDRACAVHELVPRITLQASAPDAIADLAARGLAVGILSSSMVVGYRDRLTAVVLDDVDAPALLALVWKSTCSPAVREFLVHGRDVFRAPGVGR
ncbi:LysR family transcriptional regulator [Frankia sp. CNm7]|uniref:LysR family transcriptional regulator n=1 Tax=Frankia nepalensis TaxID=1836974 RepID=A0A937RKI1_9ACTN|nr:LysR family transcriptional regulator [Frankia nepalensis]MBL7498924.1 LysR family transcriptional regulator [Frankia nepalensis]MBL7513095.1 LysR family transcriptional regulator [Frankia nepalensis]MBL7524609.1 LysR family transcriptional regulator [Frankia nepalensis]MBL7628103.1 LysR family transcriptional regulator [Frankia nepalensis]